MRHGQDFRQWQREEMARQQAEATQRRAQRDAERQAAEESCQCRTVWGHEMIAGCGHALSLEEATDAERDMYLSCASKRYYMTEKAAEAAAAIRAIAYGEPRQSAYHCYWCDGYHLSSPGHTPAPKVLSQRRKIAQRVKAEAGVTEAALQSQCWMSTPAEALAEYEQIVRPLRADARKRGYKRASFNAAA